MRPHYVGIEADHYGGMTHLGQIVKDAWVFGVLSESETCAGWSAEQMQVLQQKVAACWDQHGQLPSRLPEPLRERHTRIYQAAIEKARTLGWDPSLGEDD